MAYLANSTGYRGSFDPAVELQEAILI